MRDFDHAAVDVEAAEYSWRSFVADPAGTLGEVTLVFRDGLGRGDKGFSGSCVLAPELHAAAVAGKQQMGIEFVQVYAPRTRVAAFNVQPGGNGATYWFPYVETGVGTCDIPFDAPVATVALTAGMNGCSLRLYVDTARGLVRFCHDNNGEYARDAAMARDGFAHLLSINSTAAAVKQRGAAAENMNNYWNDDLYGGPQCGVFFISIKTAAAQWSIYRSVVLGNIRRPIIPATFFAPAFTRCVQSFFGAQTENAVQTQVAIPPRAAAAAAVAAAAIPAAAAAVPAAAVLVRP
jgi:hypothetical protein